MKIGDTGTTARSRKGVGIIRRFRYVKGTTYVRLQRENGQQAVVTLTAELSDRLLKEYGYQATPDFTSVEPLIGMKVHYEETATGMLTDVRPLKN